MDNYRDVDDAYRARIEEIILDAGLVLPVLYDGLHNKVKMEEHNRRVNEYRYGKVERRRK